MSSSLAQGRAEPPEGDTDDDHHPTVDFSTPASPPTAGWTLPQRRPSVTLHRREPSDAREREPSTSRRDTLEDTKSFVRRMSRFVSSRSPQYGVRPTSPQSRLSFRDPSRATDRALSPDQVSMPNSPPRIAAPLPIPRAFLSPKKPNAAVRLEQKLKGAQSTHAPTVEDHGPSRLTQRSSEYDYTPEPISLDAMIASGPSQDGMMRPSYTQQSLRPSIADVATPPQPRRDLSSDNLVHTRPSEATLASPRPAQSRNRRYKKLDNDQMMWLFGGRAMTGGDNPWSFLLTVVILLGLSGVWLGTTGVWLWQNGAEYGLASGGGIAVVIVFVYLFGLVVSSLLAAAFRDPGIIPRYLDPDPPLSQVESWWEPDNRELRVKDGKVIVKYCETCKSYRPPRCSHCRLCGNCVDGIDHHCSYIHTCVGKRNYLAFLVLLVTAAIAAIYIVVLSAIHFALLCHRDDISFADALADSPGAAVSFLLGVLVLPAIFFLLWYHAGLVLYNLTTVEQIRASASTNLLFARKRPDNPFGEDSRLSNILLATLARPQFPSWVHARGWDVPDSRAVNPALVDPKWAKETV